MNWQSIMVAALILASLNRNAAVAQPAEMFAVVAGVKYLQHVRMNEKHTSVSSFQCFCVPVKKQ